MFLKNDMKAKFVFLNEIEAAVGFTATMLTQEFVGSTTIVPQVSFWDYFRLFRDPRNEELYDYFQKGAVAAYEHIAMIKLHYSIADVLDECVALLEDDPSRRKRRSCFTIPNCRRSEEQRPPSIFDVILESIDSDKSEDLPVEPEGDTDDFSRDWIDLDD